MVAQQRGDYDPALEWYRKSLAIDEELGNRAGMASAYYQMGYLLTEQGVAEQGVLFTLQSLYISLELKLPQAYMVLNFLSHQREMLGEENFLRVLQEHLEEEHIQAVLELIEMAALSTEQGSPDGVKRNPG
jgi:tetratricopeptide (TPR) repeat protein